MTFFECKLKNSTDIFVKECLTSSHSYGRANHIEKWSDHSEA